MRARQRDLPQSHDYDIMRPEIWSRSCTRLRTDAPCLESSTSALCKLGPTTAFFLGPGRFSGARAYRTAHTRSGSKDLNGLKQSASLQEAWRERIEKAEAKAHELEKAAPLGSQKRFEILEICPRSARERSPLALSPATWFYHVLPHCGWLQIPGRKRLLPIPPSSQGCRHNCAPRRRGKGCQVAKRPSAIKDFWSSQSLRQSLSEPLRASQRQPAVKRPAVNWRPGKLCWGL
mgnify:CR=1 FL=1